MSPSPLLSIPDLFRSAAARAADSVAVTDAGTDGGAGLRFSELDRRSDALAGALAVRGVAPGDRVGLLCPNGVDFVVAYLGVLKAGATLVPLNLLLSPREIAYILVDSGACALIYHVDFDAAARAAEGPPLRLRVGGGTSEAGLPRLADLIAEAGEAPNPSLDPLEAVAAILYTSGTTGRPKGAMLTHGNLAANAASVAEVLGVTRRDRVLVVLPMFHAFAATVGVLTPLLHGAAVVSVPRFEPRLVSKAIADHRATLFLGVPSMYGVLLRLEDAALSQWSSLRLCVSGGAAMPAAVMQGFELRFGVPVLEGDGPTECSPVTCVNPPRGVRKPGSVGLPVPRVEMRILDAQGLGVPDGTPGEVCVRGPNVMKGYFNQPEATREAFFGDWFRTGDLGTRDADGYFYLVDRIKDLIIVNGMNVYPRAIEEVLYAHPAVAEVAVVGDPHPGHGEIPVAHLALKPGASASPAELRHWCRERLGRHEIPRRIEIHPVLPKNAAGKILKRELRVSGERERGVAAERLDP